MARTRITDASEATSGERKPLSVNDLGAPRARKALLFNDLSELTEKRGCFSVKTRPAPGLARYLSYLLMPGPESGKVGTLLV